MTNTASVPIRAAQLSDARAIAELTMQLGYEVAPATLAERLKRLLPKDDQRFLVAEHDGDVVGWVHVVIVEYVDTGVYAEIGGLVVERRQRKKGVGKLLMTRAEEWAREKGCSVVRLRSSAVRTEAHRFYEGLGYSNIKTQFTFVKAIGPAGAEAVRGFVPRVTT